MNDVSFNINEGTILHSVCGITDEKSIELWGLPSVRSLKASSVEELLKNQAVKIAAQKVKEYAKKKSLKILSYNEALPVLENFLSEQLKARNIKDTDKNAIKQVLQSQTVNGVPLVFVAETLTQGQKMGATGVGIGIILLGLAVSIGFSTVGFDGAKMALKAKKAGDVAKGVATAGAGFIASSATSSSIPRKATSNVNKVTKHFEKLNELKGRKIFTSFVCFKDSKTGKTQIKIFCNAIIEKTMEKSKEEWEEQKDWMNEIISDGVF